MLKLLICFALMFFVLGCMDDNSSIELAVTKIIYTNEQMDACNESNEGISEFLVDSNAMFVCLNGEWIKINGGKDTIVVLDTVFYRDSIIIIENTSHSSKTGILDFNPDSVMIPKLENLIYQKRNRDYKLTEKQIVILHFTDIHGDKENFNRIKEFRDHYGKYIDGVVHTGDAIYNRWPDSFSFWKNAEDFLFVLGDHDIKFKDWSDSVLAVTKQDVYERYLGPYIDKWNVVQPEKASVDGLMYYYKDFDKGEGLERAKLRLIVLDDSYWDVKQAEWLVEVLDDALENDFAVIIAKHEGLESTKFDGCPFTSMENFVGRHAMLDAQKAVDDFMNAGGEFVLWIGGDSHQDDIGTLSNYPKQIIFLGEIAGLNTVEWSDGWRKAGTPSQDCFTLIAVDRFEKMVRFLRVGANRDRYERIKESMCINYSTGKMISP